MIEKEKFGVIGTGKDIFLARKRITDERKIIEKKKTVTSMQTRDELFTASQLNCFFKVQKHLPATGLQCL